jgi:tRNA (guanine37-N1)-methyltransferase
VLFDIVTIFPRMFDGPLAQGILGRAIDRGLIRVRLRDLRDYTTDRHRVVDDVAYGGGPGMVLKPEPLFAAFDAIAADGAAPDAVLLTTPQGRPFTQATAARLSRLGHVAIICGRYEGIDERVRDRVATEEVSIGDFVLTGGELPALVMLDAVARLVPGVVGDEQSVEEDSFVRGLLDFPHYTRPAECRGLVVPDVLLSGNHAAIRRWRKQAALRRTLERRPDLLASARLDDEERALLEELLAGRKKGVGDGRD